MGELSLPGSPIPPLAQSPIRIRQKWLERILGEGTGYTVRLSMRLGAVILALLLAGGCGPRAVTIRGVAPEGAPQPVAAVSRHQPAALVTVQGKIVEK